MTPKFLQLTRKNSGEVVFINPRRANRFFPERPNTVRPEGWIQGTEFDFGRGECMIVKETVDQIVKMMK